MTEEERPNNELDPCPEDELLRDYALNQVDEQLVQSVVEAHLQFCVSCNSKVKRLRSGQSSEDFLKAQADHFRERAAAVRRGLQDGARPGSLWRAVPDLFAEEEPPYAPLLIVLGTDSGPDGRYVRVAEVSEDIEQAIHTDLILNPDESGLSFLCMIRSENIFETGYESLERWVGQLPPMLIRRVLWFCGSPGSLDEKVPLSEYVFLKDSERTTFMQRRKVTSGLLVTSDEDPRQGVLEASIARCSYLHFLAADMVAGIDLDVDSLDEELDTELDLDDRDEDDS